MCAITKINTNFISYQKILEQCFFAMKKTRDLWYRCNLWDIMFWKPTHILSQTRCIAYKCHLSKVCFIWKTFSLKRQFHYWNLYITFCFVSYNDKLTTIWIFLWKYVCTILRKNLLRLHCKSLRILNLIQIK